MPLCSTCSRALTQDVSRSHTCGCARPTSQIGLTSPEFGCPSNCDRSSAYAREMDSLPCEDSRPGSAELAAWASQVSHAGRDWPPNWSDYLPMFTQSVAQMGCAYGKSFCEGSLSNWPVKPMSYLCPVTCGCAGVVTVVRQNSARPCARARTPACA